MSKLDSFYSNLKRSFKDNSAIDWDSSLAKLKDLVGTDIEKSKLSHQYKNIIQAVGHNKNIRILDYGCGGGQLATYLLLAGYKDVYGVDVNNQEMNNDFIAKLGFKKRIFSSYDKKQLPFENDSFDLLISQQVLEHVHNLDDYYSEASRVLKKGGIALLDFPHKFIPYDSHAQKYFIHFFPRFLRKPLYNYFTEKGFEHYDSILNFQTLGHHKRIALKYFTSHENKTADRIKKFEYSGTYEGNLRLRKLVDTLIQSKVFGQAFLLIFTQLAIADIKLIK